ncbi:hypothetical protein BH11PSE11_BH11PSE11_02650 [soil metagenome]
MTQLKSIVRILHALFLFAALLALLPGAHAQLITTPLVLYTDIVSGPNTGGENNKGIYLSIFGKNFGSTGLGTTVRVYINNVEVDNYRYLGASKGRPDIQQLTVQIGALGSPTPGIPLPIKVSVNGIDSNTDQTFIVNPGRILFVDNVGGNDATAVIGDITKPYRYVQTPALYTGGAWSQVVKGDFIVMRGHGNANPWTDVGFQNYFMRYRDKSGSAPTGASNTGAIALMGYPGEDVYIRGLLTNGMTGGCISAINGESFTGLGQWAVITNLRIDCEGYDGPISQQIFGHNWRVVNNDLAASTAPRTGASIPRMAGITGNGNNSFWYGNHIHDIQGSGGECHGVYIDGDGSYDIGYNNIHDIRDGNGFQVYVNGGNGSTMSNNVSLHHNLIHDISKHGVNVADGMRNNLKVWNNVVYNVDYAALRFNSLDLVGAKIYNNTFYNTNRLHNSSYGAVMNTWQLPATAVDIQNNIFYVATGTPYDSGMASNEFPYNSGTFGVPGTIAHNLWFNGTGGTSFDSSPVVANPQFANAAGADFHLLVASPAIGVGASVVTSFVANDYDGSTARSVPIDIGAFQHGVVTAATVPGAPAIGLATAGSGQATVAFVAPASNGGSAITGYTVTSNPAGGVDSNAGGTGLSHVVTGLVNGTSYTFTVKATNIIGTGAASAASNSVTPTAVLSVPGAPIIGTATGGNAQATVTFSAPGNNGGTAITGYTVTSSPAGGSDSNAGSTGLSHVITGLVNGTNYTFTVKATNAIGTGAASLASNSVTPATVPGAPVIGTATAGNTQATVTFTAPSSNGGNAITGYTVTSNPAGGTDSNAGGTGLSHLITGLVNGTSYTFTVRATNAKGTGAASSVSNSVTPLAPPACTLSTTTPTIYLGKSATLTVTCNPAATSYQWTNTGFSSTASGGDVSPSVTTTYTVRGSNAAGNGNTSAVTVTVKPKPPAGSMLPILQMILN